MMKLSQNTKTALRMLTSGSLVLQGEYTEFMVRWMVFNQVCNDVTSAQDPQKMLTVGDRLQRHWPDLDWMAREIVQLECVGSESVAGCEILKPSRQVRAATIYLRDHMKMMHRPVPEYCEEVCRPEKKRLCSSIPSDAWNHQEMAALLCIIQQVWDTLASRSMETGAPKLGSLQAKSDLKLLHLVNTVAKQVLVFIYGEWGSV